jgi:hypothetical protein
MTTRVLNRDISVSPNKINTDYKELMLQTLEANKKLLHSIKNGYVTKILKIINYKNIISPVSANIIFNVTFLVETIILEKGLILLVNVKMIISHGILCNFKNIKIWIPCEQTNGYKYKSSIFEKNEEQIKVNDEIQVKLIEIRYEKNMFSCIALLTT